MGEMGLHENTILIVTSDHGECFLEHGELGHPPVLYDEILRVPLIIVYPPLGRKGTRITRQVMSIDILPTVLDILKISAPPHLQGRSVLPLIEKGATGPSSPAFADAVEIEAARTDAWKLIRAVEKPAAPSGAAATPPELYNLGNDPREKDNLAERDTASRASLETLLGTWRSDNEKLKTQLGEAGAPEKASLDKETKDQLRALGYLQ
jgi:arylsulfatase A-like enzyme